MRGMRSLVCSGARRKTENPIDKSQRGRRESKGYASHQTSKGNGANIDDHRGSTNRLAEKVVRFCRPAPGPFAIADWYAVDFPVVVHFLHVHLNMGVEK